MIHLCDFHPDQRVYFRGIEIAPSTWNNLACHYKPMWGRVVEVSPVGYLIIWGDDNKPYLRCPEEVFEKEIDFSKIV